MKIRTPRRNRGNLLLVVVVVLAIAGIGYLGYKTIQCLKKWNLDPNRGQGTNAVDTAWSGGMAEILAADSNATVRVPDLGLTLPITALTNEWNMAVLTSTNLRDWEPAGLYWEEALDQVRTNHGEAQRFYRRVVWYLNDKPPP